jgi:hypothetical protein
MSNYHIWRPAYVRLESVVLELFITLGDSLFLARGTDDFVKAALATLRISQEPLAWEFDAMRSHYFTSYRETSDNWEDRWSLVWRLRVKFANGSAPVIGAPPAWGYYDLDEADASFRADDRAQLWSGWPCLVVCDSAETSIIESAQSILENRFAQAICTRGEAPSSLYELRCDLGYFPRSFYEKEAAEAEEVLREIAETGASTRYRDTE